MGKPRKTLIFDLCDLQRKIRLTHNTFRSRFHLEDKDTAFRKQFGSHKDCTACRADLFSQ